MRGHTKPVLSSAPTRRAALGLGSGALLLALGGVGLALQPSVHRAARQSLLSLDPASFSVLVALAETVCPAVGDLPGAWDLGVPERVDEHLATLHPADARDVHRALLLLENGLFGLLLDGRPRTFTASDPEARRDVLTRWRDSRLTVRRSAYRALVSLVSSSYWSLPRTFAVMGYPGPPAVFG